MSVNTEFMHYQSLFRGNYAKGTNALYNMMENKTLGRMVGASEEAIAVIFSTNVVFNAAHMDLRDTFFNGKWGVGKGFSIRTRTVEPSFDQKGYLDSVDNLEELVGNSNALTVIAKSNAAMKLVSESSTLMRNFSRSPLALSLVLKNNYPSHFVNSNYAKSVYDNVLATCRSNSSYFTPRPVGSYTYSNVLYHNLTSNDWVRENPNQKNAIYCVSEPNIFPKDNTTVRVTFCGVFTDDRGESTKYFLSSAAANGKITAPINDFTIGTIKLTDGYTTAWSASQNTHGEAFMIV